MESHVVFIYVHVCSWVKGGVGGVVPKTQD